jgi:16S rRNA (guanine966-N2)-methyltransferase
MLKVLGGSLKGLSFKALESDLYRPTSVLLRRKIFDAHQDLTEFDFYDLCAGSGLVGIEALSRGAKNVFFVEINKKSIIQLRENVEYALSKCQNSSTLVINSDCMKWLETKLVAKIHDKSIFFFDPPYEQKDLYLKFLDVLSKFFYNGFVWIEGSEQKGFKVEEITSRFLTFKIYHHSNHYIICGKIN